MKPIKSYVLFCCLFSLFWGYGILAQYESDLFNEKESTSENSPDLASREIIPDTSAKTKNFISIEFNKGASTLDNEKHLSIKNLLDRIVLGKNRIIIARIAVWSDKPYSESPDLRLGFDDKWLSQARFITLYKALSHKISRTDIVFINMGTPNRNFERLFEIHSSKFKDFYLKKGSSPHASKEFLLMKQYGGISRAVVFLKVSPSNRTKDWDNTYRWYQ